LGAVAQRLVRTCCGKCKQTYQPSQEELSFLQGPPNKDITLHRSKGCNACYHTGYYGRKAIYEILSITPEIRRMIVAGCGDDEIRTQAGKEGMRTLRESGIEEVLGGATTLEELPRVVDMEQR